jgi:hypothetical protein
MHKMYHAPYKKTVGFSFFSNTKQLLLLLLLLTATSTLTIAQQSVAGSWYGIANAEIEDGMSNNYLVELNIRQKGNEIEGVLGYYFRDGYQSYFVRGKFDQRTQRVIIKNLPISYFRGKNIDGADCYMDFEAVLMASKVKSRLKGSFMPHEKYIYTCPSLRINYQRDSVEVPKDSMAAMRGKAAAVRKYWQPTKADMVITSKPPDTLPSLAINNKDTLLKGATKPISKEVYRKLMQNFEQRKTIVQKEIPIENDSIRVSFYDNGDIDGDSISVFVNKVPVLTHQVLSAKSFNMYLAFSEEKPITDISMFAENLGTIPPNTALMIVTDGDVRHEVYMTSSLTHNATVRLRRRKK